MRRLAWCVVCAVGCAAPVSMTTRSMIPVMERMETVINGTDDLALVREGMPTGILMVEGLVSEHPRNSRVRLLAVKLYTAYAMAFCQADNAWARSLLARARDHGLAGLPGGQRLAKGTFTEAAREISRMGRSQVPLLFWTAQAWASLIRLGLDDPRNQADLARVEIMMDRVLELDDTYYHGGAYLFKGVLLGAKPPMAGGDPDAGIALMERAIRISGGRWLLPLAYQAQLLASIPGRESEARSVIWRILEAPLDQGTTLTFTNALAKATARQLMEELGEEE